MRAFTILHIALSCINTAVAWTSTDHWQTDLMTVGETMTISGTVYPREGASATLTSTSTTLYRGFDYTLTITVYDLFYPSTADVCTLGEFRSCSTPTPRTSNSITTTYWAPVLIANPTSCTKTSFEYTTASTIDLPSDKLPDAAQQATQSVEALLVTTYVTTLSTNLGGQAVTTSVCDVYLRSGAVSREDVAESYALSQCMDPRDYYCQKFSSVISENPTTTVDDGTTCELSGQTYPPTAIAGAATGAATTGTTSPTQGSGAGGLGISPMKFGVSLAVSGFTALLVSFY